MQLDRRKTSRRRGIAGLIAAVIMFTLLFTVGLGFYLNLNEANAQLQQAQEARIANEQAAVSENLLVTAMVSPNNTLEFVVTNQGGVTVTIVAYFATGYNVTVSNSTITSNVVPGSSSPLEVLSPGNSWTDTTSVPCVVTTQQCSITVVTSRGNDFPAFYPPATGQLTTQAGVSEGFGLLSFNFASFNSYLCLSSHGSTASCTPTPPCSLAQPLCSGYQVPPDVTGNASSSAFSFAIRNLDPCQRAITIDDATELTMTDLESNFIHNQNITSATWPLAYLVSGRLYSSGNNITLAYGQQATVYFAFSSIYAANCNWYGGWGGSCDRFSSDPYSVSLSLVGSTSGGTMECPTGSYGQVFPLFTTIWQPPAQHYYGY